MRVQVSKLGQLLVEETHAWPTWESTTRKSREDVVGDMGEVLGVYGELGMRARAVVVTGLGEAGVEGEEGSEVPFIPGGTSRR